MGNPASTTTRILLGHFDGTSCSAVAVKSAIERSRDWCLENNFELVTWDRSNPHGNGFINEKGKESNTPSRNKTGVPRLLEAFQSTMWTNMIFKTDARPFEGRNL